jgi:hypothetical protein
VLEQLGEIEPVIGVPRIAAAALLAERDGRAALGDAARGELGADDVNEAQERRAHAIDAAIADLDDGPLAVGARLLGVERESTAAALHDGPEAGRQIRGGGARTVGRPAALGRLVESEQDHVRREDAAVVGGQECCQARRRRQTHVRLEAGCGVRARAWEKSGPL